MMLKKIFFIGFLLPISLLYAQTDFRPGYVITHSNDTLYGEIDYRGDLLMGQVCKFRSNKRDIVSYTPYDIAAYRFTDSKYFVSREVSGQKVFLEFLVKGQVNFYYMRDNTGNRYFIDKEEMPLAEMPYEENIREKDNKEYLYTSKTHLGLLIYYMQDAPGIVQKRTVQLKRRPEHYALIKLAEDYHHAVCTDGEPCIVFEKKQPLIKVAVDVAGGMEYLRTGESSFTGGVLLNFWMPRVNEKMYFRTGLLFSKYDEIYEYEQFIYTIPLMFEYIYPKSVIRPKVAYGQKVYSLSTLPFVVGPSISCMGGFNIRFNEWISLSMEYNIDFTHSYFFFPRQFIAHSFLGGFHVKF